MHITTTDTLPGYEVTATVGIVDASVAWSEGQAKELKDLRKHGTKEDIRHRSTEAIREAFAELRREAEEMGADAVIGVRFCTFQGSELEASVLNLSAHFVTIVMYVYGTAVRATKVVRKAIPIKEQHVTG